MIEEKTLNPNFHDRQAFTCGVSELDIFLQRFAIPESKCNWVIFVSLSLFSTASTVKPRLNYTLTRGIQQSKNGISFVRVLIDTDTPSTILGYYSLSAAQIDATTLDVRAQEKLPRYPVPCFRLGRLVAHSSDHGRGLGRLLIGCVVERCFQARQHVAAYALVVDVKSRAAQAFYEHYGFIPCLDNPMTLFLPLSTTEHLKQNAW